MFVEVKNVSKEYKRGEHAFKAVDDANLSINPSDFVCIVGKSGGGKSTLLNIIAGLMKPTSGNVEIDGKIITSLTDTETAIYRNEKIGYIPQWQSTLSAFNVIDNVRLPFHLSKRKGDSSSKAYELLKQLDIVHLAENYPKHLSGGELKRVAIARALINAPSLLIADEPTGELDKQTSTKALLLLKDIAKSGTAVLMVTHDLDAIDYCTQSFTMESGVLNKYN